VFVPSSVNGPGLGARTRTTAKLPERATRIMMAAGRLQAPIVAWHFARQSSGRDVRETISESGLDGRADGSAEGSDPRPGASDVRGVHGGSPLRPRGRLLLQAGGGRGGRFRDEPPRLAGLRDPP